MDGISVFLYACSIVTGLAFSILSNARVVEREDKGRVVPERSWE